MTTLIIFLMILFVPFVGHADGIQPPTQKEWRHAETCSQAVAVATRQSSFDMEQIGVPLNSDQIRPIMFQKLKSLPSSPCYQPSKSIKSGKRSRN